MFQGDELPSPSPSVYPELLHKHHRSGSLGRDEPDVDAMRDNTTSSPLARGKE